MVLPVRVVTKTVASAVLDLRQMTLSNVPRYSKDSQRWHQIKTKQVCSKLWLKVSGITSGHVGPSFNRRLPLSSGLCFGRSVEGGIGFCSFHWEQSEHCSFFFLLSPFWLPGLRSLAGCKRRRESVALGGVGGR